MLGTPSTAVALTLVNPAAESGSLTGWTSELGAFTTATSNPSPAEGTRYFTAGSVAESLMRQDVALPGAVLAQVDAGLGLVRLLWKQRNVDTTSDRGSASLAFLDASGQPLGSTYEGKQVAMDSWTERSLELLVPPGARTVRLKLHGLRVSGTKNDAHFDDVRLSYEPLFTARPRLLASIDGPRSDVADTTGFTHDTSGNLTGVTNALGQVTQIAAHDARGLPLTVIDPNGVQSTLTYDERGRLLSATVDSGVGGSPATTGFTYDPVGQITRLTLPDGSWLDYTWDAAHRLAQVTNGLSEKIEYTRDAMGNVTRTDVKSAGGTIVRTQSAAFDELGRLLRDVGAVAQSTAYGYDRNDNLTSLTDPLSHATAFAYDALDRLVRQTDALAGETDRAWDSRDGLASLADARDVTTSFVRNGFGEEIQEASPDRGTTVYVRDAAGNVTQRSDGRGVVANATFDALDRQLGLAFPATPTLNRSFGYDATAGGNKGIGRLTSLADAQGSASFGYDARGNLLSETRVIGGQSYTTGYAWDLGDHLVSLTYPSGRIVSYARDGLGRVTAVTTRANAAASPVTVASGITYRPFGPIAGMGLGNGLALAFSYDGDGRLTGIATTPGVQGLTLGYDTASRLIGIADALIPGRSQTLGYDALDRLTSAVGGYGSLTYAWDAGGNRTGRAWTQGGTTSTDSATYAGTSNRLLSVSRGGQSRSLGYDGAGNVTSDTRFDGTAFGYGHDGDGRLATVTRNALPEVSYGYDAFQRRVLKTAGGLTRHFLYDPDGHLLAEATAAGATTTEYVWLGDAPLAMVADADTASPRLFWFHTDQLGTPQKLTDGAGNLAWDAVLEPFGELASLTVNLVAQPLRLPGQYADPDTGLHQNWWRDYDPSLGRYLQPDPLGISAAANLYGYVDGNPITGFDRDGRIWDTLLDLGFLGYDLHRLAMDGPCGLGENLTAVGADLVGAALPFVTGLGLATRGVGKGLGGNPFRGKTPEQLDRLFRARGFEPKGVNPIGGEGAYVNPKTGRPYHIDARHPPPKGPHVGVYRPRSERSKGLAKARDYPL